MLDKKYDHIKVEEGKYASWLKHNYFKAGDLAKENLSAYGVLASDTIRYIPLAIKNFLASNV